MEISSHRLVDSFLIMPNANAMFGERAAQTPLGKVASFAYGDVAQIYLTQLGAIGLTFLDGGSLASIEQFQTHGVGAIPDHVTEQNHVVTALQGRRLGRSV